MSRLAARALLVVTANALVTVAAVRHFGFVDGLAIDAAIWLLMPYASAS